MVANLLAVTRGIFTDEKIITELEIFYQFFLFAFAVKINPGDDLYFSRTIL